MTQLGYTLVMKWNIWIDNRFALEHTLKDLKGCASNVSLFPLLFLAKAEWHLLKGFGQFLFFVS